jgi:hypothetical protein
MNSIKIEFSNHGKIGGFMIFINSNFLHRLVLTILMVGFINILFPNELIAAPKSKQTVSKSMFVLDQLASELLESLNPKSLVAIRPFSKKDAGIPEKLSSSLINGLVGSLRRQTNYQMNVVEREKLLKIWEEVEQFKNSDINRLVKEAGADILIIGDIRTRKKGLELSFRAYDTRSGKTGQIVASTRLHYLEIDWKNETGFSPEQSERAVKDISKALLIIMESGGVIKNPKRPEQFYHNARVQEQGGDYVNAGRSYRRYFTFKLNFLDPHLRYQTFLKVQEGRAGAREVYNEIYQNDRRPVVEFSRILLFNTPQRTQMLKDFIAKNPNFAPAYYELSREYSEARKGTQSLTDKKAELKALQEFETLREGGKFFKFFVDKKLASKWILDVKKRLKLLSLVAETSARSPVTMTAFASNQSWKVNLMFSEKVREIFYKLEGEGGFKSTGLLGYIDPTTGLGMPNPMVNLSLSVENTTIFVKYIDINKNERGPFELKFVGKELIESSNQKILKQTKMSWLNLRKYQGKLIIYFSHLLGNKCGLSKIKYGVDRDVPDQVLEIGTCNIKNSHRVTGQSYVKYPLDTKFVTVQVTYADGSISDVQKFMNEKIKNNKRRRCPSDPNQRYHDCFGTSISDHGKYVGKWKDDKPNGQGTFTYSDGRKYIGEYKNGKPSGYGTFSYPDGRKYVGQYKNGERNGQGTFTDADGEKKKGIWKNSKFQ